MNSLKYNYLKVVFQSYILEVPAVLMSLAVISVRIHEKILRYCVNSV